MSNVRTSAGSTLDITSALPATYNAAGYAALAYKAVAEITDLGEFGREYSKVEHKPLANRRVVKRKGSFDEGSMSLSLGRDLEDEGQIELRAASESDASYAYRITLQDGTKFYFTAQCMSFKTRIGGVDDITGATTSLEIDNDILEVFPA